MDFRKSRYLATVQHKIQEEMPPLELALQIAGLFVPSQRAVPVGSG